MTTPQIHESWLEVLGDEFEKDYIANLREFLREEQQAHSIYPPNSMIFNAFNTTPFEQVKVVILGQDPYHGAGQAHGLSFSVQRGVRVPPSLRNIYKELNQTLDIPIARHGDLTSWAEQGVLLLNTILTVREANPKSHAGKGWETFTDRVIDELNAQREGLIFVLWGTPARKKSSRIDTNRHKILTSVHPSPLSAKRGFFGSNHFGQINEYLTERGEDPINWELPE